MPGETQAEVIDRITSHSMRVMRGIENEDVGGLVGAYRRAQDDVMARIEELFRTSQFATPNQWTFTEMTATGRNAQLLSSIRQRLNQLQGEASEQVMKAGISQFETSRTRTAYGLDMATPPAMRVQVPILPEQTIRALLSEPFQGAMFSQRIGAITDAMASDIRDELVQSMINGETMQDASARVADVIGSSNLTSPRSGTSRALTIARTEVMRAQHLGRITSYMDNDALIDGDPETAWVWVVTPDDRLCRWCMRREGKTPEEIEKMAAGADPWGNKATLPLHPNCRCTSAPKLKTWRQLGIDMPEEYGEEDRGYRDPVTGKWKIAPVVPFDKWQETTAR